jgi:DDE superfamily endonuclease
MWCIGELTEEYCSRMYALLELYARPMSCAEPVICIDEKSLQLIGHSRAPLPINSRNPEKVDYEYVRNGTTNLFVAVEPKAGRRTVSVTERRGKADFVAFVGDLLTRTYAKARCVHLVLDNLKSASSVARVWTGALKADTVCNARLTRGSRLEMPLSEPSSGRLLARMRT